MASLYGRRWRDQRFLWSPTFSRRQEQSYPSENRRLEVQPDQSILDAFLEDKQLPLDLDPPHYTYECLRTFLKTARKSDLTKNLAQIPHDEILAIVDGRRDVKSTDKQFVRNWGFYSQYPPKGDDIDIGVFNTPQLYSKLLGDVCLSSCISHSN